MRNIIPSIRLLFCIIFLHISAGLEAQKSNYSLKEFNASKHFFNAVYFGNSVYLGTDQGVFILEEGKLIPYDTAIIGPIATKKGVLTEGVVKISDNFKNLLPKNYINIPINELLIEDTLLIVAKGKLFVFEKNAFQIRNVGSVRAISKNYVGTYNGVYRKKDSLRILEYTNSYIREFEKATFFCWDGLYVQMDSITKRFNNRLYSGVEIGNKLIGKANDIVEIQHPNYILSTDQGLFTVDVENEIATLLSNEFSEAIFANYLELYSKNPGGNLDFLLFSQDKSIYSIDKKTNTIDKVYSFNENIKSFLFASSDEYYILFENSLVKFEPSLPIDRKSRSRGEVSGKVEQIILMDNLRLTNDVGCYKDFIFVTSDLGLHLYDKNSEISGTNIISEELNKKAFYVAKDSLYLGGVNGIYSFDYASLANMFFRKVNQKKPEKNTVIDFTKRYQWQLIGGFVFLLLISNLVFFSKFKTAQKIKIRASRDIKQEIENYIEENLSTVNIEKLKTEFRFSNNQLYSHMGSVNPGEVIRAKRVSLVKKLRKNKISEEEIAKATGFSISYLKKI